MRIGLITRCKNEPFIHEFVNHYLNEGIDHIFIIDDNSKKETYNKIENSQGVTIVSDIKFRNGPEINEQYRKIRNQFDWMISVDPDEFITTRRNPNNTIRQELNTTFKNVDCIKIPWVMMSFNAREHNPESLLEENIYRWNHDKKHITSSKISKFRCRYDRIEIKSIFRTSSFRSCFMHTPEKPGFKRPIIVDSVKNDPQNLEHFYDNLRENDIESAHLVCYHYRTISIEQIDQKIEDNRIKAYQSRNVREMLINFDYPELCDYTMREKSLIRMKRF